MMPDYPPGMRFIGCESAPAPGCNCNNKASASGRPALVGMHTFRIRCCCILETNNDNTLMKLGAVGDNHRARAIHVLSSTCGPVFALSRAVAWSLNDTRGPDQAVLHISSDGRLSINPRRATATSSFKAAQSISPSKACDRRSAGRVVVSG